MYSRASGQPAIVQESIIVITAMTMMSSCTLGVKILCCLHEVPTAWEQNTSLIIIVHDNVLGELLPGPLLLNPLQEVRPDKFRTMFAIQRTLLIAVCCHVLVNSQVYSLARTIIESAQGVQPSPNLR